MLIEIALFIFLFFLLTGKLRISRSGASPLFWGVLAYFGIYCASGIVGINPFGSFWGTMERGEGIITNLHFLAFFLIIFFSLKEDKYWDRLFDIFFIGNIIIFFLTLWQGLSTIFIFGESAERSFSSFGNPAFLASYSIFGMFFSLLFLTKKETGYKKALYLSSFTAAFASLVLSGTRGAFWGAEVGLFIFFIGILLYAKSRRLKLLFISLAFFMLIALIIILFGGNLAPKYSNIFSRLANIDANDASIKARVVSWSASYEAFKERPLMGSGPENFDALFNKYHPKNFFKYSSGIFDRPHNKFLELLNDGGLLLLSIYLFILGSAIWCAYSVFEKKPAFFAVVAFFIAYSIQNFFIFDTISTYILFYFIIAWLSFKYLEKIYYSQKVATDYVPVLEENQQYFKTIINKNMAYSLLIIIGTALALIFYFTNIKILHAGYLGVLANKKMDSGIATISENNSSQKNMNEFLMTAKSAINESGPYREEFRIRMFEPFYQSLYGEVLAAILKEDWRSIQSAAEEVEKNIEEQASGKYLHISYLMAAGLYYDLVAKDLKYITRAIEILDNGMDIYPNRIEFIRDSGKYYLVRGENNIDKKAGSDDLKIALFYFNKALTLDKTDGQSHWNLGVAQIENNMIIDGFTSIKTATFYGYKLNGSNLNFLISVAQKENDFENMAYWLQEAINIEPDNHRLYIALTSAYVKAGDRQKAKEVLQKLIRISEDENEILILKDYINKLGN